MPDLFIEKLLNYGLGGFSILCCFAITVLMVKLERRVLSVETHDEVREEDEKERSKMCEKHRSYFTDAFGRIEQIEKKHVKADGRFDNIDTKLENLDDKIGNVGKDVKTIVDHFTQKGMGA